MAAHPLTKSENSNTNNLVAFIVLTGPISLYQESCSHAPSFAWNSVFRSKFQEIFVARMTPRQPNWGFIPIQNASGNIGDDTFAISIEDFRFNIPAPTFTP